MSPSPDDYVELRCRSAFSFLEGASNPEALAERAAELGGRLRRSDPLLPENRKTLLKQVLGI